MNDYAQIISHAKDFVLRVFAEDCSGHDYHHTFRVHALAMRIAEQEGACLPIVELAALLHDVDDHKLSPETSEDCLRAATFLQDEGLGQEDILRIIHIIQQISFSRNTLPPDTPEGRCVQDADRLDAIGAVGIARAFAYGGSHNRLMHHPDIAPKTNMTKEEYVNSKSTTVNHFYEKLFKLADIMNTDTAKAIARERDAYMRGFVDEFLNEWEGIK